MLKIANRIISQPAAVQAAAQTQTEQPASTQSQTAEATKVVSSENTWQRAGLQQNEIMQKSVLNQKLTAQKSSLVGTAVGGHIAIKSDHENKKDALRDMINTANEEIKKLQAELDKMYDSNFVATDNFFNGRDEGAEESDVSRTIAKEVTATSSNDDDD